MATYLTGSIPDKPLIYYFSSQQSYFWGLILLTSFYYANTDPHLCALIHTHTWLLINSTVSFCQCGLTCRFFFFLLSCFLHFLPIWSLCQFAPTSQLSVVPRLPTSEYSLAYVSFKTCEANWTAAQRYISELRSNINYSLLHIKAYRHPKLVRLLKRDRRPPAMDGRSMVTIPWQYGYHISVGPITDPITAMLFWVHNIFWLIGEQYTQITQSN